MTSLLGAFSRTYLKTRIRHLLHDCDFDVNCYRHSFAKNTRPFSTGPSGVKISKEIIADVPCEWIVPDEVIHQDQFILFFHGGGFVLEAQKSHYEFCSDIARQIGARLLSVNYRLAPEFPFPAAPRDCLTVYEEILKRGHLGKNLILGGDSAGGSLCLSTIASAINKGLQIPAAAFCLSPLTGYNLIEGKRTGNDDLIQDTDQMFSKETLQFFMNCYFGKNAKVDLTLDHQSAPILSKFKSFPPLLITASENEFLFKESVQAVEVARENGTSVEFITEKNLFHVYPLAGLLPEAKAARKKIVQFIKTHWRLS